MRHHRLLGKFPGVSELQQQWLWRQQWLVVYEHQGMLSAGKMATFCAEGKRVCSAWQPVCEVCATRTRVVI